jgi:TonB-dependent SusC/RagA subfamily outer membrane receptor
MESIRRVSLSLAALIGVSIGCAPPAAKTPQTRPDVSTVTSEDLQDSRESIESVIQKKVSGVVVRRTDDGGIALQIRGATGYGAAPAPPLYILNGLPFRPGPDGALTGVNPLDIDTIKVLKGAEAGIYGIDGANGVIVITTKQAGKR